MKTTIKFAALGAIALAASSTAALAGLVRRFPASPPVFLWLHLCQKASTTLSIDAVQQQGPRRRSRSRDPGLAHLVDTVSDRWRPYPTRRHDALGKR